MESNGSNSRDDSGFVAKLKAHKALSLGIGAGFIILAAVLIFVSLSGRTDQSRVDDATLALEQTSLGLAKTRELDRAANKLESGSPNKAKKLANGAVGRLNALEADAPPDYPDLKSGVSNAVAAAKEISSLSGRLLRAKTVLGRATKQKVTLLSSESKALGKLAGQQITIAENLDQARQGFRQVIEEATTVLEDEDALSDDAKTRAAKARDTISKVTSGADKSSGEQIKRSIVTIQRSLKTKIDRLLNVSGPYDCGTNDAGAQIVVNAGTTSCKTARFVIENSSGPNEATAPTGWDCSGFAMNLDGQKLLGASGYSCSNETATVSVFVAGAEPAPAISSIGDAPGFISPKRNLVCTLSPPIPGNPAGATCRALEKAWEPPPKPADCNLDWDGLLQVDYDSARFVCGGSAIDASTLPVLYYGETVQREAIQCSSAEDGITCSNLETGSGFRIARDSYELDP